MSEQKTVAQVVQFILENIVDHPEDVVIREEVGEKTTVLIIKANKADLGKIIGKDGYNARALKTIASAVGSKRNIRVQTYVND